MKFRVGDIVKIKEEFDGRDSINFMSEMKKYCGKQAKIVSVIYPYYKLDIDKGDWFWDGNILETLQEEYQKWKPKKSEDYWTIDLSYDTNTIKFKWDGLEQDNELYRKGLVFKTEDEVKRTADKMLKAI